jgi:DNA-binding MarR family transcriptional regulator
MDRTIDEEDQLEGSREAGRGEIDPRRLHVSDWVRSTEKRFSRNFTKLLEAWDLIPSEWTALRELCRPQWMSPVELGQAIGMSKGGASKLVDRLVRKGYVRKEVPEFDRRFRSVGLTRYAREVMPLLASIAKEVDREFFGPLGNGRRFRLAEWLKGTIRAVRKRHMESWVLRQIEERRWIPPRGHARPKEDPRAEADAEADALWDLCLQSAAKAAAEMFGEDR